MQLSEGHITAQDGVRLFYQKLGSGAPSVIVPNALHVFDGLEPLAGDRSIVFFDLRHRGRSETITDPSKLTRGIHHDVEDFEAIRRHFGIERADLIGHSYQGLAVILYAIKYAAVTRRVIQIGPIQPHAATIYSAHLTNSDATLTQFLAQLPQVQKDLEGLDPVESARRFWDLLKTLMVADPADAAKITYKPYDYANELHFMKHWTEVLMPSIQALALTPEDLAEVAAPVLTIHGVKDRQAPYGAGRDWALRLPNARLLTVSNAAHLPWIENPDLVYGSIRTFLDEAWPDAAEQVHSLDPA